MHRSIPSLRKCCLTLLRHDRSSHFAVIEDVSVNTHQQRPPLRAESYFQSAALLNARWQEQGYGFGWPRAVSIRCYFCNFSAKRGEVTDKESILRSVFNDLLFRRRECLFFAFDLLFLNGEALQALPLMESKISLSLDDGL